MIAQEDTPVAEFTSYVPAQVLGNSRTKAAWWAVVVRFLIHGLVASAWISRIPTIQTSLNLNNAALGLCLLGTAVGSVMAIPVAGWLVTRFGSKVVTTWSSVAFCLALVGPTFASSAFSLFVFLILYGAAAGANDVSMNSQAVAVEDAMGTPTMSRFHAMFSIGGMAGAVLGGVAAARDFTPREHLGTVAAVLLLTAALTSSLLLDANDAVPKRSTEKLQFNRLPGLVIALVVIGFCMFLSEGAMADWTAVYLKQVLFAGPGLAATGYAVFSAGMAVFRLLGDSVTKRLGPVLTVRSGALMAAAGLTFALCAPSSHWALPGFALTGAGFSVIVPLVFAAGGRVPGVQRGAGVALVSGCGYIGFLFGPPIIGFVSQWVTLRGALVLVVGLSLLAASLAKAVRPNRRQTSQLS
jgi:predicted MFS family arabinose efflux permease